MALIVPIRSNNAYIGIGKQTVGGTAVAPTVFPRWLDGSQLEFALKTESIREGDTTRRLSQVIKNQQYVKVKLLCLPRPVELGFLEQAAMGTGADTFTTAAYSSSVAATHAVGDTTLVVGSVTGLPTPPCALVYDPGSTTEEIVQVSSNATTTLTVAPLKYAHGTNKTILSSSSHAIADQSAGDYYTVEVGIGNLFGAGGPTLRVRDCKVESIKRSSKAGMLLTYEVDFVGITTTQTGSPATPTYELHPPFYYESGVWTLDGATTGDALVVESFAIEQKNNLDVGIQSEALTLDATIFGLLDVSVTYDVVFTNPAKIYSAYFGSATGTTDAQAIGAGALSVNFTQADNFHALTLTCTTLHYTKVGVPVPKVDGKHFAMPVTAESVTNQSANPNVIQATVLNTRNTVY